MGDLDVKFTPSRDLDIKCDYQMILWYIPYKPVLITNLYHFTNLYCILTSTELRDVLSLPRVSPVSPVCLYVLKR